MNTGHNLDTTDYNKILAHADKTIKELRDEIKLYIMVIEQLKSQDGKQITKRVEKYITLPGYNFYYTKRYDHFYIGISKFSHHTEIALADYKEPKLSIKYMASQLAIREAKLITDIAAQENITQIVIQYNVSLKCYKAAEEQLRTIPGFYDLNRW